MSNKQSSVEWLMQKIALKYGAFEAIAFYEEFYEEFKQAKSMHREEIVESHIDGFNTPSDYFDAEIYYNQTFGGNNE